MTSSKLEQWQEMCDRVSQWADGLGRQIDQGIFETVVVLNLLGMPTTMSCEGHFDRAQAGPWVHIKDHQTEEQETVVRQLFQEADQARAEQKLLKEEVASLYKVAREAQLEVMKVQITLHHKLMNYLVAFYEHRTVPYDVQLVINSLGYTGRLENLGVDFQKIASPETKQQKLTAYQEEMRAFTGFLKEQFFQNKDTDEM